MNSSCWRWTYRGQPGPYPSPPSPSSLQGRYVFQLLAVDVQGAAGTLRPGAAGGTAAEGVARLYLHGDAAVYGRGGVMEAMRTPYLGVRGG